MKIKETLILTTLICFSVAMFYWSFLTVQTMEYRLKALDYQLRWLEIKVERTNNETEIKRDTLTGNATWYDYSLKGFPDYSKTHLTAASRDFKRGTHLRVCTPEVYSKCVDVVVNDYGPQRNDRIIDLSSAAFRKLSPLSQGVLAVWVWEIK